MDLIFTDLDGTLLDHDSYSWEAARPALDLLRSQGVPWVMVSSKTRAEVEYWRAGMGNAHPFIVENGGAAYVPAGYFATPVQGSTRRGAYEVLEWGTPYQQLVADLREAARSSGCRVQGFHAMTAEHTARITGLPLEQAMLARQREYDEPFVVLDAERAGELTRAIEWLGRRWTRGGRFWHILGANDKALAVGAVTGLFRQAGDRVRTIGLGDGLNDAEFLNLVDIAVLIRSPRTKELQARVARAIVTASTGPQGWSEAVLRLLGSQVTP